MNKFVLAPVEPTEEMIVAFAEAWYSKRQTIDDPDMLDAYRNMLAAAPQPPALGGESEVIYMLRNTAFNTPWRDADKAEFYCAAGLVEYERRELVDRAHVAQLQAEVDELKRERKQLDSTLAEAIHERDQLQAEAVRRSTAPYGQNLADRAAHHLLMHGAENYVGEVFTITLDEDAGQFEIVVTTQKVGAKSPHEMHKEAATERDQLKARTAELKAAGRDLLRTLGLAVSGSAAYNKALIDFDAALTKTEGQQS